MIPIETPMKKYELFWRDVHIGSLTETNWDMRSSGEIRYHFNYLEPEEHTERLADFIRLSMQGSHCLEYGKMDEYEKICEEEKQYLDLIYTADWYLLNSANETILILCPLFHENDEITWQVSTE